MGQEVAVCEWSGVEWRVRICDDEKAKGTDGWLVR